MWTIEIFLQSHYFYWLLASINFGIPGLMADSGVINLKALEKGMDKNLVTLHELHV